MKKIHLIGIGGTGLSAIARVLLENGHAVSGSDRVASPLFKAITSAGAKTYLGHAAEQVAGADLVIRSSAIPDDNPEVIAAKAEGIPVLKRSEFLKDLTQDKDTLAVAGSHGKTTTTAMIIWMLDRLGLDPSFIAGGVVNQLDCNARAGTGLYFAIEADEYDHMFLGLAPKIAIITNIEHDHPDCFPTEADYRAAFKAFLERVRADGVALLCLDDPATHDLMQEMDDVDFTMLSYGTSNQAHYLADELQNNEVGLPEFDLLFRDPESGEAHHKIGQASLRIPGQHNVLNATAALGAIHQLGLPIKEAIDALTHFTGAGRRFEVIGTANGVTVIDDYGHHSTEIAATLKAARSRYPGQKIWAIWEPHTYSRTKKLEPAFIEALDLADSVVVLKVYAAREESPGYTSEVIAQKLPGHKGVYMDDFDTASSFLLANLSPGDIAIVFSAGDATQISQTVLSGLRKRERHA